MRGDGIDREEHVTAILKKLKSHSRTHVVVSMSKFGTDTVLAGNPT